MSLYNLLFGVNPHAGLVLAMLGMRDADVPRFRDAWIEGDGSLVIYTRTGGGNRDDYEEENARLAAHPWYVRDEDDEYDSTYARFIYQPTEQAGQIARELAQTLASDHREPRERWQKLLADLDAGADTPETRASKLVLERILAQLKDAGDGGKIDI